MRGVTTSASSTSNPDGTGLALHLEKDTHYVLNALDKAILS